MDGLDECRFASRCCLARVQRSMLMDVGSKRLAVRLASPQSVVVVQMAGLVPFHADCESLAGT